MLFYLFLLQSALFYFVCHTAVVICDNILLYQIKQRLLAELIREYVNQALDLVKVHKLQHTCVIIILT